MFSIIFHSIQIVSAIPRCMLNHLTKRTLLHATLKHFSNECATSSKKIFAHLTLWLTLDYWGRKILLAINLSQNIHWLDVYSANSTEKVSHVVIFCGPSILHFGEKSSISSCISSHKRSSMKHSFSWKKAKPMEIFISTCFNCAVILDMGETKRLLSIGCAVNEVYLDHRNLTMWQMSITIRMFYSMSNVALYFDVINLKLIKIRVIEWEELPFWILSLQTSQIINQVILDSFHFLLA